MGEHQLARAVRGEVLGVPVDHAPADVQLLQVQGLQIARGHGVVVGPGHARGLGVPGDHALEHLQADDVREMAVGAVAFPVHGPEDHDGGLHRVGGVERHDLQPLQVVPCALGEVVALEIMVELLLVAQGQGRKLLHHRGPHQGGGVVLHPAARAHERGQAAEMVVVGMGVEHPGHLVHPDAERPQAVVQVRPGVDQVHLALEHQDAGHGRAVHVPAVAVPGVQHAEILPAHQVVAQGVGGLVMRPGGQVQVHHHGLLAVGEGELVHAQPGDEHAVPDFPGSSSTTTRSRNSSMRRMVPKANLSFRRIISRAWRALAPAARSSSALMSP